MSDDLQSVDHLEGQRTIGSSAQLEYPQLLIEASFESLLTHSQRSLPAAETSMPLSETSLSESWSSLSEHDLHDDDLESEVTDSVSLIDVSTTEDVHTVDEDGDSTDSEDVQELLNDEEVEGLEDSCLRSNEAISLQATKSYADIDSQSLTAGHDSRDFSLDASEITQISMSAYSLNVGRRPYQIIYYGSALSSTEIKSDVLGKIGAALITSDDHYNFDEKTTPPSYHVVPSEFGPGSRPSTADLIPIPTQMHVNDCDVVDLQHSTNSSMTIRLRLGNDWIVTSRPAYRLGEVQGIPWEQPDLIVVVVSRHDCVDDQIKAQRIAEFATRHHYPLICLRQESGYMEDDVLASSNAYMLHKLVQLSSGELIDNKTLLDVDSFLSLDTEQISRHLNFITVFTMRIKESDLKASESAWNHLQHVYDQCKSIISRVPLRTTSDEYSTTSRRTRYIIQTSTTDERNIQGISQEKKKFSLSENKYACALDALTQKGSTIGIAILTICMVYLFQAFLHQWLTDIPSHAQSAASNMSFSSQSFVSTRTGTATATATSQVFALSGPFQAIEQQVQNWLPVNIAKVKPLADGQQKAALPGKVILAGNEACYNIVPAHISPSLKVDPKFFKAGDVAFDLHVLRGKDKVTAKIEKQSDGNAVIMIRRKDSHGLLTIHLTQADNHICATLDLENSFKEALTFWVTSLRHQGHKLKTAKRFINDYTRLLEVRTARSGLLNNALEAHYTAARGLGAAVEAVEKSAIKHAKSCSKNKDDCFTRNFGFAKQSLSQARQSSEDFIQGTQKQIADTAKHLEDSTKRARDRVHKAGEQVREEVSKAIQVVQNSIGELTELGKIWPGKASRSLHKAQKHAHKLTRKTRRGDRNRKDDI